jgi:H+/Cl- antiporter ClcA
MPKLSFRAKLRNWTGFKTPEDQLAILLSLVIGILVGLTVVAFILLTGWLGARMYPPESAVWRRLLVPILGTVVSGICYRVPTRDRRLSLKRTRPACMRSRAKPRKRRSG